jgi:hypothetical protein
MTLWYQRGPGGLACIPRGDQMTDPTVPQTPPEPTAAPGRSWPRRHKIVTVLFTIVGLIVVIVAVSVTGSHKSTPPAASPAVTPAATASPTPTLSAAQQTFVSDMRSQFGFSGASANDIVAIGAETCSQRESGVSQSATITTVVSDNGLTGGGSTGYGGIIRLSETDLCPKYLPPQTVTYIVTGAAGDAQVTYGPAGTNDTGSVPMSVTQPLGDPSYYAIDAQLQGGGTVSCSIDVNGVPISTASASGGYNIADCEIGQDPVTGAWENDNSG